MGGSHDEFLVHKASGSLRRALLLGVDLTLPLLPFFHPAHTAAASAASAGYYSPKTQVHR